MDETDWGSCETGPYCRHWDDFTECKILCTACGHRCQDHNYSDDSSECLSEGCKCKKFTDDE